MSKKSRQDEPEEKTGGFTGSGLAFALGAATALVVERFWRQILKGTVTGAVRTQRRIKEISAEVMEDVEDAWAEGSDQGAGSAAGTPGGAPDEPKDA